MYRLKTNKGFKKTLNLLILTFLSVSLFAQQKQFQAVGIGFYNVENLFDTIRSAGFVDGTKDYQDQFYHISISQDSISKYAKDTVNCKCSLTEKKYPRQKNHQKFNSTKRIFTTRSQSVEYRKIQSKT